MTYDVDSGETKDELIRVIQVKLDQIVSKEVCDAVYESHSREVKEKSSEELDQECKTRKNAIINVISSSVCLERLYFVIRTSIMGLMTGLLTYAVISIFGITNFFDLILLGIFAFIVSLMASRYFDGPIVKVCHFILKYLDRHQRLRVFILRRL
ncbi:MAG: hypothetical protein FWG55_02500 [Candidatus Bathyarchaeota archaeon]|nr:hypothetical protein [Candidatus Termiticorpusculum sp.]